jgi:hypothetical protein
MMYFKSVLVGLGTVLLGCLVTPIALVIWWSWKSETANKAGPAGPGEVQTVSFSPMGLENHLAHSLGFWVFIIALFSAGFLPSVYFLKRRRLSKLRRH